MVGVPERFLLTISVAAALSAASPIARADTETAEVARAVALSGVEGPGAAEINAALVAAFEKNGYAVERGKAANGAESSGYVAVVTGKIIKRKRRLTATIQLRSAPGGEPLASVRFRGDNAKLLAREVRRDAWDKLGPSLETRVQSMTETVTPPPPEPVSRPEPEPEPTPAPVVDKPEKAAGPPSHGKDTGEQIYVQADGTKFTRLSTRGARRTGPIVIDGKDKDKAWKAVPETLIDWQQRPFEGYGKNQQQTYFRVLYDDEAIYVFVRAADTDPSQIKGILNRGDDFALSTGSDWIAILIDPTINRRNGYGFQVNPAGVKIDYRVLDDANIYDLAYNPVWEVKNVRNEHGWTAEVRIPYSQMRVQPGFQNQWGFQVYRRYMRELSHFYWSPQPHSTGRHTGLWGSLDIEDKVTPGRAFQIAPYTAAGVELNTVAEADTINDEVRPIGKLGVDLQVALTDGLVFTSAVNPDFGQVEADPSEVNLTGRESFFSERRPFFTKDDELFLMPVGRTSERIYYTRRVGAPPRLTQAGAAQFVDEDQATSIYNASKITGQLPGGFTLGLLGAITAEEKSRGQLMNGDISTITIDPMTTYSVGQIGNTFRGGDSDLRLSGTGVHRFLDGTDIETLTTNAYSGGLQYTHRFGEQKWNLQLQALGSHVEGSTTAIDIIQRASPRYFQRPDAEHLDYDPSRTTLTGYAGKLSLARAGLAWAGSVGVDARAPEFETNDMGFLLDADLINTWADLAFTSFSKGLAKQTDVSGSVNSYGDFSGEILRHQFAVKSALSFRNDTSVTTKMSYLLNQLDTRLLRGGPAVAGSDEVAAGMVYNTDLKASFVIKPQFDYAFRPDSASRRFTALCNFKWNPATNVEINLTPTFTSNIDRAQFVPPPQVDAEMNVHYILGRIYQRTLFATTRLSYTFTPQIAFDIYAQPFLSVGKFSEFKEPDELRSRDFDARFRPVPVTNEMGMIGADFDGDGAADSTFRSPDFSITRLNTNVVFRWEYLPGSFMYAIFSNSARGFAPDGTLSKDDYETVWTAEGEKAFLIKLSYWWDR